jgi:hypothetical protein
VVAGVTIVCGLLALRLPRDAAQVQSH